ncbi:MAG: hypothetical protein ACHQTF_01220 [Gemmatimonadales bacterium]|jgi:hypothetical protein
MEQDQYTGKTGATPPRAAGSPLSGAGSQPPGEQHSGLSRTSVWVAIAVVLVAGLFLYFRYERGIAALFDRSH